MSESRGADEDASSAPTPPLCDDASLRERRAAHAARAPVRGAGRQGAGTHGAARRARQRARRHSVSVRERPL
jgi:hypothetical protein